MKNLKILSMDLGKRFISVRDKKRKEQMIDFVMEKDYDLILLQGSNVEKMIDLSYFEKADYNINITNKKMVTLLRPEYKFFSVSTESNECSRNIFYYERRPIACLNVNCKYAENFYDVLEGCDFYSNPKSYGYVPSRIITGKFPRGIDTNEFCDAFDLEDVSTLVAHKAHIEYNQEMLHHLFISRNLDCKNIHKLVGLTEVSKIGEAYPIKATISYKKVLK